MSIDNRDENNAQTLMTAFAGLFYSCRNGRIFIYIFFILDQNPNEPKKMRKSFVSPFVILSQTENVSLFMNNQIK